MTESSWACALYVDSPFSDLKSKGTAAFPRGDAAAAADQLLNSLVEVIGIVPVRVGELEGFASHVRVAKGPAWLPAVLESRRA